jgi:hypothetical protein
MNRQVKYRLWDPVPFTMNNGVHFATLNTQF